MWGQVPTNKTVGGLFPNDGDGNAWGDPKLGFPPVLAKKGYRLVDPGRYQNLTSDFTAQINAFKQASADVVTGVVIPPDFTTFWTQARQQGFAPKVGDDRQGAVVPGLGRGARAKPGNNLSTVKSGGRPTHPFKSSLTGADGAQTLPTPTPPPPGKQWTQPIGFAHALFEVAVDALKRALASRTTKDAAIKAVAATKLDTLVGRVDWGSGPVKNVAKTPLVGGQWRRTPNGPFKLRPRHHHQRDGADGPVGGKMQPLGLRRVRGGDASLSTKRLQELWRADRDRCAVDRSSRPARRSASSDRTAPARPRCST